VIPNTWKPPFKHFDREGFDLAKPHRLYSCGVRGNVESTDAGEERQGGQNNSLPFGHLFFPLF